jgi:hypothetical protein
VAGGGCHVDSKHAKKSKSKRPPRGCKNKIFFGLQLSTRTMPMTMNEVLVLVKVTYLLRYQALF